MARIAKESGRKSARIRRKMLQNAQAGLPHGSARPFGYEADKITVREPEAAVIRRYLAGQPLRSLTIWLNESQVAPSVAASWQTTAVRQVLSSGHIAGLREHRGEVIVGTIVRHTRLGIPRVDLEQAVVNVGVRSCRCGDRLCRGNRVAGAASRR